MDNSKTATWLKSPAIASDCITQYAGGIGKLVNLVSFRNSLSLLSFPSLLSLANLIPSLNLKGTSSRRKIWNYEEIVMQQTFRDGNHGPGEGHVDRSSLSHVPRWHWLYFAKLE